MGTGLIETPLPRPVQGRGEGWSEGSRAPATPLRPGLPSALLRSTTGLAGPACPLISQKRFLRHRERGTLETSRERGRDAGREEAGGRQRARPPCRQRWWLRWSPAGWCAEISGTGFGTGKPAPSRQVYRVLLGQCKHGLTRFLCGLWSWYRSLHFHWRCRWP